MEPHLDPLPLAPPVAGIILDAPATVEEAMSSGAACGAGRRPPRGRRGRRSPRRSGLALGYARSGRFRDAHPQFQHALRQFEAIGDLIGQARIHNSLTWLSEREQRPGNALSHATRSLDLYRAAGHQPGQAMALNDIGYCHALLGHYQQAITCCEQALDAVRAAGERNWEAATWDSLGYIHDQLGDCEQSVACYERAIDLYRKLTDRFNEADTLDHLGDARHRAGDIEAARATWIRAVRIFDEIDHPDGDRVRAKLEPTAHRRFASLP